MRGRNAPRRCDVRTLYYTPMSAKEAAREAEQGTGRAASSGAVGENGADAVNVHYDTRLPELPWSRRIQIPFIAAAVYSVIRALGPTLRYEVLGWQHAEGVYASGKRCIWAFWHRVIIPIVWWHRNHGTVVMNTTAFDGQWTRKAGCPVMVFHIGVDRGKTFTKTWDHFLMPMPFARTVILFAPPIYVPADADQQMLEAKHAEMQRELERVRDLAESWFSLREGDRARFRVEFGKGT